MARETGWFLSHLPASRQMTEAAGASPDSAALLRQVAGSIGAALVRIGETPEQRCVETEADLHVLRFAMISHHFGHNFIASVMQWLEKTM
ncbi:hypothetical protein PENTCL1PPCAC_28152, partial [Pristionchus entomophagus]